MKIKTYEFQVYGRVQGVWFRQSSKQQAGQLGLHGWVRNTQAGTVTGVVTGDEAALALFQAWLRVGPPQAQITRLNWQQIADGEFSEFEIRQ